MYIEKDKFTSPAQPTYQSNRSHIYSEFLIHQFPPNSPAYKQKKQNKPMKKQGEVGPMRRQGKLL
jgi:hypothetical protein